MSGACWAQAMTDSLKLPSCMSPLEADNYTFCGHNQEILDDGSPTIGAGSAPCGEVFLPRGEYRIKWSFQRLFGLPITCRNEHAPTA